MLPRISIVVPSFNAVTTIERTLHSLLSQSYQNLELICVDGRSDDGTQKIIEKYSGKIAHYICEEDNSQSEALNKGFQRATGAIYGWLCADDELTSGTLHAIGTLFSTHPEVDVFTGGCRRVFDDGSEYFTEPAEEFLDELYLKNTIEQPSTFWRSRVHSSIGSLSETMKYAFDWEYWCRMKHAGFRFERVTTSFSVYYFSDSNLTSTGGRAIVDEMFQIVRKYGPYGGKLAWAYRFLYRVFDLQGFYDQDTELRVVSKYCFYSALRLLYIIFDERSINAYNWNFASRQERGKAW